MIVNLPEFLEALVKSTQRQLRGTRMSLNTSLQVSTALIRAGTAEAVTASLSFFALLFNSLRFCK